jgi:hypothetical protein
MGIDVLQRYFSRIPVRYSPIPCLPWTITVRFEVCRKREVLTAIAPTRKAFIGKPELHRRDEFWIYSFGYLLKVKYTQRTRDLGFAVP